MNYVTHNEQPINAYATSKQGVINESYYFLTDVFGPQISRIDDITSALWEIEFDDGVIATIYDWDTGLTPFKNTQWNIGGYNWLSYSHVMDVINEYHIRFNQEDESIRETDRTTT